MNLTRMLTAPPPAREPPKMRRNGLVINASTSEKGWSYYSKIQVCKRKLFLNGIRKPETTQGGLLKGSMGHLLQAHHRVIQQFEDDEDSVVLCGADPADIDNWNLGHLRLDNSTLRLNTADVLADPLTALDEWLTKNPNGNAFKAGLVQTYNNWCRRVDPINAYARTLAVETQLILDLGHNKKTGEFGLFIRPDATAVHLATIELPEYEPVLIDAPGTRLHGSPIYVSRRADHIIARGSSKIIVDHKHTVDVQPDDANGKYAIDGGFQLFQIIGERLWGSEFGGNQLNLISTREYRVEVPMVRRAPGAMKTMPRTIQLLANEGAYLEEKILSEDVGIEDFENKMNETGPCAGMKYGKCVFFNCCLNNNIMAPLATNKDD